jgi:hypothetical protein
MKDLLKAVPHDLPDDQDWILPDSDERPSPLDSAYLRGVRQMLFDIDPHRHFGGLSRIQATSGEYLWVCPEHRTTDHRAAPDDHIP